MWYPSNVTTALTEEPVTLQEVKQQCLVESSDDDVLLTRLIKAARSHVEEYCNARFAVQTIRTECDSFSDFARLPEGPLKSVTSIIYFDPAGAEQTLDAAVYEPRRDGLEPSISLKSGQAWPRIKPGSRITLTAVYGGSAPDSVRHAMLMLIDHWYLNRSAAVTGTIATTIPAGVDALLSNNRRGV